MLDTIYLQNGLWTALLSSHQEELMMLQLNSSSMHCTNCFENFTLSMDPSFSFHFFFLFLDFLSNLIWNNHFLQTVELLTDVLNASPNNFAEWEKWLLQLTIDQNTTLVLLNKCILFSRNFSGHTFTCIISGNKIWCDYWKRKLPKLIHSHLMLECTNLFQDTGICHSPRRLRRAH